MTMRWELKKPDANAVRLLCERMGLSRLAAIVLVNRGLCDPAEAETFRNPRLAGLPSFEGMAGIPEAVGHIADAVQAREPICIYGDFDADGVTAASALVEFFKGAGYPVQYFIPDRADHGYGFHPQVVKQLAEEGVRLIITVDLGITGHEACRTARQLGVKVVITDHHEIDASLPEADAVVNPHQPQCSFHDEDLTGVGIAFFLAGALRAEFVKRGMASRGDMDIKKLLDLVAIGTIADIAPVTGVNRPLIKTGLDLLSEEKRPGIAALKKVCGMSKRPVNYGNVAFNLAPRVNAAGRIASGKTAVELFTTTDLDKAKSLAADLEAFNEKRKQIETEVHQTARKMVADNPHLERLKTLVVVGRDWNPGVIGIVAGRIQEEFHRPTVVISLDGDTGRGSGRSVRGFDLHEALASCSKHLEGFGGHQQAAGITIRAGEIESFMVAFESFGRKRITPEMMVKVFDVDAWCDLAELDEQTVVQIDSIAPFGIGNPKPIFAVKKARVIFKALIKDAHLKLRLAVGPAVLTAMGWRMAGRYRDVGDYLDVAFTVEMNEFRGVRNVQLVIVDFKTPGQSGDVGKTDGTS